METTIQAYDPNGAKVGVKATLGGVLYTASIERIWTAKGYGRQAMATSAVASLVVRPTTTAMATLFNNTNKHFVIERLFAHNLVAAAQCVSTLWACIHPVGMTAPTNDITVRNKTNGAVGDTEGIFDNGATVVDNGWFPIGKDSTVVTVTTPGGILEAEVGGRLIVPPTAAISIQVVSSVTTATFCAGLHWFAVPATELGVS